MLLTLVLARVLLVKGPFELFQETANERGSAYDEAAELYMLPHRRITNANTNTIRAIVGIEKMERLK